MQSSWKNWGNDILGNFSPVICYKKNPMRWVLVKISIWICYLWEISQTPRHSAKSQGWLLPCFSEAFVFLPLSFRFSLETQEIIYRSTGSFLCWNCLSFPPFLCFRRVAMLWKDLIFFYFIVIRGKVKRVRPINKKMPRYTETTCLNAQAWLFCSMSNN